ncbi:Crp/Fnr family transcriptional regulator [Microvirga sp. W0021]|uniref:Crp/Fnr family transcriptional regulator n=1 Tax=Hohaiivirga grylli TaxID=3133970 RepID=A0ABV0BIP2_9HYPH
MSEGMPKTLEAEVSALQRIPMFQGVDAKRLKLLAFASERISFSVGQKLFSQGDPSDFAYVILEGSADIFINGHEGMVKVAQFTEHQMVGEMGILTRNPRSATVIAASPMTVLRINKDVFFELTSHFPQMGMAVMVELAVRLEQSNARLVEFLTK